MRIHGARLRHAIIVCNVYTDRNGITTDRMIGLVSSPLLDRRREFVTWRETKEDDRHLKIERGAALNQPVKTDPGRRSVLIKGWEPTAAPRPSAYGRYGALFDFATILASETS
ncbi:MAG: hypothetical protein AAGF88_09620 [Pseudomonadota bacterium]